MKNKQGFSAVVVIIILAILAGGGYAIWKNKNYTPLPALPEGEGLENWQTYRNDEYGFEFKYPPELKDVGLKNSFTLISLTTPPSAPDSRTRYGFYVSTDPELISWFDNEKFSSSTVINGVNIKESAVIFDPEEGGGGRSQYFLLKQRDRQFVVNLYSEALSNENEKYSSQYEVFQKILSTFRFTE